MEIPGLKGALIKILHDFNLQVSLLEGCQTIMNGDCADLVHKLHRNQSSGFFLSGQCIYSSILASFCIDDTFQSTLLYFLSCVVRQAVKTPCPICNKPIGQTPQSLTLLFLCRHVVHADCVEHDSELPQQPDPTLVGMGIGGQPGLSGKIALWVHRSIGSSIVRHVAHT